MQESVGVEIKQMQLVTKTLPIMEHYVSTYFGVRKEFFGKRRANLAGRYQGNAVSVNKHRDS